METRQVINLTKLSQSIHEEYKNFIVNEVNDSCLRMAVFQGIYRWHHHPNGDELFLVLEGELSIDFTDGTTQIIRPNEMYTVSAGVVHRTRAEVRTVNLCFEYLDSETVLDDVKL